MPNAKVLEEKKAVVASYAEKMKNAKAGVLVNYCGITVEQDTALRRKLRENGVEYAVVKNTLLKLAAEEAGFGGLSGHLNGTTAIAISMEDVIAPAKIICEFSKENEDILDVKAGFIEGKLADNKEIKALAALPPKEVLVAKVLGSLNAPISGFVGVLNANLRALVIALNAVAQKKA